MDHLQAKFIEEAIDLINDLEEAVLSLEADKSDMSTVQAIFRVMHTFKGNSTMFGFDKVGEFTHHLETIYDNVREGKMVVTDDILNITLASVDHIRMLLEDVNLEDDDNRQAHEDLTKKVINAVGGKSAHHQEVSVSEESVEEKGMATYLVRFKPSEDVFLDGTNPLFLVDDLKMLGQIVAVPHVIGLTDVLSFKAKHCYTYWDVFLATEEDENEIMDVFIFVEDSFEIEIKKLVNFNIVDDQGFIDAADDVIKNQDESIDSLLAIIEQKKNEIAAEEAILADAKRIEDEEKKKIALEAKKKKDGEKKQGGSAAPISSIRVSSEKLDDLMGLVSELVTTQARLSLFAEKNKDTELQNIAEEVEKLSRRLRDDTFSICLLPVETMLMRFQRLVRDTAKDLGKNISFITKGGDTELDKNIIESITDPLMHILRNSMDHGIEMPDVRIAKGKDPQGTIEFKAFYSGTNVIIQIKDDGGGINPDKIREKAISKGLISEATQLSKGEIFQLLFHAGFSTAEKVTSVSGRGVGMDVVKRNITELRGEIEIESEVDQGSMMSIKLPLTLSIVDGLLVKVDQVEYIIPLGVIDKCFEVPRTEIDDNFDSVLVLDGRQVPFIDLVTEFESKGERQENQQIVVISNDEHRVGLVVDSIIGEYQAVLKPLGPLYKDQDFVSGATILGDGTVALIIDTNQVVKELQVTQLA